ncbi:MAG TPA: alpha-amylase family glycosyl hydrolase [Rectinemataceae bacterium]
MPSGQDAWWKEAVFYQIYPRSFMDSDDDGQGDLRGIISRLDYLSWLGVDAIWISPFFSSPMADLGYDVADYLSVDPIFGTLEDFNDLVEGIHGRGMRLVLDLVVNHSSDEHPWFKEARASRESPKHDWYIWAEGSGKPPNTWKAVFELGSAWHRNPATGEFYLGTFTSRQPEFNWRNEELRDAVFGIMKTWFDRGADGFRLDVATAYLKDEKLRSNPFSFKAVPDFFQRHIYDRNQAEVGDIFRRMRELADGYVSPSPRGSPSGQRVLVGEPYGDAPETCALCYGPDNAGLHLAFDFDFLHQRWKAEAFRAAIERLDSALPAGAQPCLALSNHDQPRHAHRLGMSSRTGAAALLLCLRCTPFLYYGEELGLGWSPVARKDLRDPLGKKTWPIPFLGRDPERRPMPWNGGPGSGFTRGEPWLPLEPGYEHDNVEAQARDPGSMLSWYRRLLSLRRSRASLRRGEQRFLEGLPRGVLGFERRLEISGAEMEAARAAPATEPAPVPRNEHVLVLINFLARPRRLSLDGVHRVLEGNERRTGERLDGGRFVLGAEEVLILEPEPGSLA